MCRIRKKKNLDFMKVEKQKQKQEAAGRRGKTILSLLPLALMLIYLQSYIYYMEKTDEMEKQILEIQSMLYHQGIIEEEARLDQVRQKTELLERYEEEAGSLGAASEERKVLTSDVLKTVESVMEGRVEMVWDAGIPLHFEEGILEFTARTRVPLEASEYAERLEAEAGFEDVEYHGFERRNGAEGEDREVYLFEITCRLAPPEAEEKKEEENEKIIET